MTWMKRVTARPCGAKAVKHFGRVERARKLARTTVSRELCRSATAVGREDTSRRTVLLPEADKETSLEKKEAPY